MGVLVTATVLRITNGKIPTGAVSSKCVVVSSRSDDGT